MAWPSIVPTVSTVRGAVEGLDARPGDYLFVEFGNNDTVLFQVAHQSDLEALGGEARLAREVGLRLGVEGPLTVLIAESLGMSGDPPPSRNEILQRLRARGEEDLAALVETTVGPGSDDDLMDTLLRTFGGRS